MRGISIRIKAAVAVAVLLAISLAAALYFHAQREMAATRAELVESTALAAVVVGEYSAAELAFDDPTESRKSLSKLARIAYVERAALYDAEGRLFSSYVAGNEAYEPAAAINPSTLYVARFVDGYLEVVAPVDYEGVRYGTIVVHSSTRRLDDRLTGFVYAAGALGFGVLILALVLALVLHRLISRPILELAAVAQRVADGDFSLRVGKARGGEIGVLRAGIDDMLAALDRRHREVRTSTETLETLIDASPFAIIGTDERGEVTLWSSQAEEVFDTPAEYALGKPVEPALGKGKSLLLAVMEHARRGEQMVAIEMSWQAPDDELAHFSVSSSPLEGEGGKSKSNGTVTIVEDITKRKLVEDSLRDREEQLSRARKMEAIGRLAGGIAHDFNNLLTVVLATCSLISRRVAGNRELLDHVKRVEEAANRGAALTRQLLAFSRYQVVQHEDVRVNDVVSGMDQMLKTLLGEDVTLEIALGADVGTVRADTGQLEQVLLNLAINARDAMPTGGKITITTARLIRNAEDTRPGKLSLGAGDWLILDVSDTGHGMDDRTAKQIFDPFFTTKDPGKGTGLGLSTVYGIVKNTGGDIFVESEAGVGTTFSVCLPHHALPAEQTEPVVTVEPRAIRPASQQYTVLLVEDQQDVRDLACGILEDHGYRVLVASGGQEALSIAEQHAGPIDLLLSDVVMPEMSGPAVARKLASFRPETPVLYMSGYVGDALQRHGIAGEDVPLLNKPFGPGALLRKVQQVIIDSAPARRARPASRRQSEPATKTPPA